MQNPVTVEVTRGEHVESWHRGMAVVVDGRGKTLFSIGDVEAPIFPRSACKAMQALPLIESGAADAFGLTQRELALACASHSGEQAHVETASAMLFKAGRDVGALECGAHWSLDQKTLINQVRMLDAPTSLHNNCSGKHCGFVCTCVHAGWAHEGYSNYDHPLQAEIRAVMEELTGAKLSPGLCGTDGCSIPTYALPLHSLALGFARMTTGIGLSALRATASRRLMEACMTEPFFVAGTDRACTKVMQIAPGKIFAKTGAEGVFVAALPEQGLAMAVKCEDGTTRAAECMIFALLARYFEPNSETRARLEGLASRTIKNWNGIPVGVIRPTKLLN